MRIIPEGQRSTLTAVAQIRRFTQSCGHSGLLQAASSSERSRVPRPALQRRHQFACARRQSRGRICIFFAYQNHEQDRSGATRTKQISETRSIYVAISGTISTVNYQYGESLPAAASSLEMSGKYFSEVQYYNGNPMHRHIGMDQSPTRKLNVIFEVDHGVRPRPPSFL